MSNRDAIRAKFLASPRRGHRETYTTHDGAITVEVAPLSIAGRREIARKAFVGESVDLTRMKLLAIIEMTREPGTDERIFEDTDLDVMLSTLCGDDIDELGELCVKLMNGTKRAQEEAEKNSEGTPSDNASS